jgi:hypothetical protein
VADVDDLDCYFVLDAFAEIHQEEKEERLTCMNCLLHETTPLPQRHASRGSNKVSANASAQIEL